MTERPGIMVYFDLLDTLRDYTTTEAGELFIAMLEYGTTGAIPDFTDRGMKTVWRGLQQKIDRDNLKYQATIEARQYATYCREYRKKYNGADPPTMEEWKNQKISNDSFGIQLQQQQQPQQQPAEGMQGGISPNPEDFLLKLGGYGR